MTAVMPFPPIAWSPQTTATGDPRLPVAPAPVEVPLVWRPCVTCWQQGRMWHVQEARNGEGKVGRWATCWTCLGTGSVQA